MTACLVTTKHTILKKLWASACAALSLLVLTRHNCGLCAVLGLSRIIRLAYHEDASYVPLLRRAFALWRELEAETGQASVIGWLPTLAYTQPTQPMQQYDLRSAVSYTRVACLWNNAHWSCTTLPLPCLPEISRASMFPELLPSC